MEDDTGLNSALTHHESARINAKYADDILLVENKKVIAEELRVMRNSCYILAKETIPKCWRFNRESIFGLEQYGKAVRRSAFNANSTVSR